MIPVNYTSQLPTRTAKTNRAFRLGFVSARFIGFLLLALFLLLYIAQNSEGANKQVQLQELRNQDDNLNQTNRDLELEAYRLRSLSTLEQDSTITQQLTPVQSVEHLK